MLRLEDKYRSRHWIFDTTRLPNLESITLVGAGVLLTSTFGVPHDTAAVEFNEGKEDQHVIEFHLGLEAGTGPPRSPENTPYLPWLVELLKKPGRTFRVFREHDYELLITKFDADAVSGRLQRLMRLKFHADTGRLVGTVSALCTVSGQWIRIRLKSALLATVKPVSLRRRRGSTTGLRLYVLSRPIKGHR